MTVVVIIGLIVLLGVLVVAKNRAGSSGGPTPPNALRERTIHRQDERRGQHHVDDGWEEE